MPNLNPWQRVLLNPIAFRVLVALMGVLIGLVGGLLAIVITDLISPLSSEQRRFAIVGFAVLGLVIGVVGQWKR